MTSAARFSPRDRPSKPHHSAARRGRILAKALLGTLAVVGGGITLVTAAMAGLGWMLAVSSQGRSDLRQVAFTAPSERLALSSFASGMRHEPVAVATFAEPPEHREVYITPVLQPLGAFAGVAAIAPTQSDDQIITGSLGAVPAKLAALDSGTPIHPAPSDAVPPPLPRVRPRLASLTPPDANVIKPEESERSRRTAIYDISAQMVYLPNGERLEAHSGLGGLMDNPGSLRQRNRGVTPPNTYDLKLRESLFHGVQAIRLTPVNEDAMFGRAGILAHSYMLGPSGQSNGCVSFKDYPKFLRAYLRGEVDRLVVVPHLSRSPTFVERPRVLSEAGAVF
jgi:hypothetical protein